MQDFRDDSLIDAWTHKYAAGSDQITVGAELDTKREVATSVSTVLVADQALTPSAPPSVDAYLAAKYLNGT